ncbi:MAG: homocysteine S-methyltransferase family protein [Oscillospiraceae bacterium]|nr:homocysteine S-methyltransferase family protein [Oscillospiraceae bacterium]
MTGGSEGAALDFLSVLGKKRLVFDGAMGTALQEKGLEAGALPDLWNITNPNAVLETHRAFVRAGCDIITANTFGANGLKLAGTGFDTAGVVSAGVALAKKAAMKTGAFTALDVGPTGKLLAPLGSLDFEDAVSLFAETVAAGARAGADVILIETMSDTYEIKAAMLAAKENSDLPVIVTFTPGENGRLLTGGDILAAVTLIESLGAAALGLNCGHGPKQMKSLLQELAGYASIPVLVQPNAGMPRLADGKTVYDVGPEEFAGDMAEIAALCQLIGGCCGTTPAHLAAAVSSCRDVAFTPAAPKSFTCVSSYGKAVMFGGKTVIIGERLNPTGKLLMKQALRDGDMDYICREGLSQIEHGAEILDVNVGLPEIDECALLSRACESLQAVTSTPLQIDTANPLAAERALRRYNGRPLLNSVSGKEESLDQTLPLAKKYGAALVALTLDDAGIPETAQGRVRVAQKIIERAEKAGIPKKDIIFDALTMTVSTGADNAKITLEAVQYLRHTLGVNTVLGVSNVSFGLPERQRINAAFFTLAMGNGLSAGIVNPLENAMMDAYYAYNALNGADDAFAGYIGRFAGQDAAAAPPKEEKKADLFGAIVSGLREKAGDAARELAKSLTPIEIIDAYLIPALDRVGADYANQTIFLPQLLISAEAAKHAFEALNIPGGGARENRGKIVLATVKGDIHDIGKNIVKALLENYNFHVIDLGKNTPPELIAETVVKEDIRLVGLSALMTTTVVSMEETIRLLREKAPDCRVMVGGAVLTAEYAEKIGADFYSKDATGAVRCAERIFS